MNKPTTVEQAPQHVKLAVDLIMLLEQNQVPPQQVLDALEIVKQDYLKKAHAEIEQKN
ncbi:MULTISPECIES: YbaM family protein [Pseudoalteromonas]|uniref:YbaM family protein n=1 Tax=Pseudoalteromonas obscura TaxID=3048491 RepID=A0ABT7EHR5_9GAMM|nr:MULTISPECIES: YbaM family protein [Pseudoalteromonas]MBQ4836223.1 YbaM family protein [Pseudoalteromonas luteoviolacea]MDK2594573.1 YbaM family protein [Pseudoalteromonas sp. P94(2023)]